MDGAFIQSICAQCGLGTLVKNEERLLGGLMHTMYRVTTQIGDYAVKLLNPAVMQRPDVFDNLRLAELLEDKLAAANIPVVPALNINGQKMQCIDGQYFYVFHYINASALVPLAIGATHCEQMGFLLAKIHGLELAHQACSQDPIRIPWEQYCRLADTALPELAPVLQQKSAMLYALLDDVNAALKRLPDIRCICNGDMDRKNVLWLQDRPFIIDLESLNYGNPYMELMELALSWSGFDSGEVNLDLVGCFTDAYKRASAIAEIDWALMYDCGHLNRLLWLEYNLKRALKIEYASEADQALGIAQVSHTIKQIQYYASIKTPLLRRLQSPFNV